METFTSQLTQLFAEQGRPADVEAMQRYMKNKFEFFGIKKPLRAKLTQDFLKSKDLPEYESLTLIINDLWESPQRELQYVGMELLLMHKKSWKPEILDLMEKMIVKKSWWDTVDFIASNLVGNYFVRFPENISDKIQQWLYSENIWLQRTVILFQLKYKKATDQKLLFESIRYLADSKEFFIQKAIGWALREYAKTQPTAVIQFTDSETLKPLSRREALKNLS
ncbi:MAG: DNA alkylation repair protein [Verrucomicrobia bacterium]|nr:DNA alkylation repair protein [Cytophagales bacterium]